MFTADVRDGWPANAVPLAGYFTRPPEGSTQNF